MIVSKEADVIKKELAKIRVKIQLSGLDAEARGALLEDLSHIASDFAESIERFQWFLDKRQNKVFKVITE